MIWACDAEGRATYLSPEWLALTGLSRHEAEGWGYLSAVHLDDRQMIRSTMLAAGRVAAPFTVIFRLCRLVDECLWVVGGATPSFSPQDGSFLGFLGSVSELPPGAPDRNAAQGEVGTYMPLPPSPLTQPSSTLDLIADHLLIARALAKAAEEEVLTSLLDMGLLETGRRLANAHLDAPLN